MAQRQQIQEAHWMHEAFVLQIPADLFFERRDIRQHVAVRDHDSPGLGGSARGEDDLERFVACDAGG